MIIQEVPGREFRRKAEENQRRDSKDQRGGETREVRDGQDEEDQTPERISKEETNELKKGTWKLLK